MPEVNVQTFSSSHAATIKAPTQRCHSESTNDTKICSAGRCPVRNAPHQQASPLKTPRKYCRLDTSLRDADLARHFERTVILVSLERGVTHTPKWHLNPSVAKRPETILPAHAASQRKLASKVNACVAGTEDSGPPRDSVPSNPSFGWWHCPVAGDTSLTKRLQSFQSIRWGSALPRDRGPSLHQEPLFCRVVAPQFRLGCRQCSVSSCRVVGLALARLFLNNVWRASWWYSSLGWHFGL